MPSPLGHALAGLSTAWFSEALGLPRTRNPATPGQPWAVSEQALLLTCAAVAVAPDLDILLGSHRTYTHSIGAAAVAWLIARLVTRRSDIATVVSAAYASHLLLDWLGKDTSVPGGLEALWPFSSRFYISGADIFMEISRRYWKPDEFIIGNLKAAGGEVLIMAPVAALAWYLSRTARTDR